MMAVVIVVAFEMINVDEQESGVLAEICGA